MAGKFTMSNRIHPSAEFIGDIELGDGNYFGPNVVVLGPTIIGNGNFFGSNVCIGAPAQDESSDFAVLLDKYSGTGKQQVIIGSGNIFREGVQINAGMSRPTTVGDSCYVMASSNIEHDSIVENSVKIASGVRMGGFCMVMQSAYLGIGSVFHQFSVIGSYSMVGANSTAIKSSIVLPFSKVAGAPLRCIGPNYIKLEKLGIEVDLPMWEHYQVNPNDCANTYLRDEAVRYQSMVYINERFSKGS